MSDIETLDLASENQRLRERVAAIVAEANEHMSEMASVACGFAWDLGVRSNIPAWFEQAFFRAQRDDAIARADKLQAERDAALAEIRRLKSTGDGNEANRAWYEFGVKDGTEFTLIERDTARVERNAAQNNLKLMAEGCEAVREYLADHGGEPYRAPSKEATRD